MTVPVAHDASDQRERHDHTNNLVTPPRSLDLASFEVVMKDLHHFDNAIEIFINFFFVYQ